MFHRIASAAFLCIPASVGCSQKFQAFRFPEPVRDARSIMARRGDCDAMRLTPTQREFCEKLTVSGAEPVASAAWGSAAIPVLWKGGKTVEQDEQGLPDRDFVVVGTVRGVVYSPLYLFQRTIVEDQFRRAAKAVDADAVAYAEAGPMLPVLLDWFTAAVQFRGLLIKYEADAPTTTTQPAGQ